MILIFSKTVKVKSSSFVFRKNKPMNLQEVLEFRRSGKRYDEAQKIDEVVKNVWHFLL